MKGGVWPKMRLSVIAVAVAIVFASALGPNSAFADSSTERNTDTRSPQHPHSRSARQPHNPSADRPASDAIMRTTAVPPDLDQRRRDGHMTPEERRLLRQHIEDAVRELYKR
ncbi:hypothetical protein J8I87_33365 [Paraburkholderia sp. LEh10]|uniref:hypothetical protein n=1 Tax=Paraburkholderia sp. LEh10 TaxID=2821353 RepID=UPI001AEA2CA0|nr:hypothetical protein [Paraburkholderia sp. LEh10]MBP0594472.1 hypothetical protein [Paraburkholderia sp. LEh10]